MRLQSVGDAWSGKVICGEQWKCRSSWGQRDFLQPRLAVASVAMRIVEHGAQHPGLRCDIPVAPRAARDIGRAAGSADYPHFLLFRGLAHRGMMPRWGVKQRGGSGRLVQSG